MSSLEQLMEEIDNQSSPPVHLWKPDFCGDIDIRIDNQGRWFHEGTQINREKLWQLFAGVLWFENNEYYLVTPVEKLRIVVEDVPFIAESADLVEGQWVITTNANDRVIIGKEHKVELRQYQGIWVTYIHIRYDLWARASRNVYSQWLNCVADNNSQDQDNLDFTLRSGDYTFLVAST